MAQGQDLSTWLVYFLCNQKCVESKLKSSYWFLNLGACLEVFDTTVMEINGVSDSKAIIWKLTIKRYGNK